VIRAWLDRRRADADRRVLAALRHSPPTGRHELWERTGVRPRRLRRSLTRLESAGLIASEVVNYPPGTPPWRLYRLACPCGADAAGAGHEPGCREATR
jgi:DNA-binding Lrp family transcriptional regulator